MQLQDKVALVTGAGSGIGRAIAHRFAQEGAFVVLNDANAQSLERVSEELPCAPSSRMSVQADISDSSAVNAMFDQVRQRVGRLDVLVNNAGIDRVPGDGSQEREARILQRIEEVRRGETELTHPDQIADMSDEGWQRMIDVNLTGTFFCCRAGVRLMIEAGNSGSIINLSSTAGLSGEGSGVHYAASKGGIIALTKGLALELGSRGIRVNAICPGAIDTPLVENFPEALVKHMTTRVPMGRRGRPEEVASTALFLASEESSYFTGQWFSPNGGLLMA
jgi:3-oxoacyl-[acyl-carrier protein] reductase